LINDSVEAGLMTPQEAIAQYGEIERQIITFESSLTTWGNTNVLNFLGGGRDRLVDVENAKINLQLKRAALMQMMMGVQ
jgi:hypothetical protein